MKKDTFSRVLELKHSGLKHAEIIATMNKQGYKTPKGLEINPAFVAYALSPAKASKKIIGSKIIKRRKKRETTILNIPYEPSMPLVVLMGTPTDVNNALDKLSRIGGK